MNKYTVSYNSADWRTAISQKLQDEGVVIVTDVYSQNQADETIEELKTIFTTIDNKLKDEKQWSNTDNLPVRKGTWMVHTAFSGLPIIWKYRQCDHLCDIFKAAYNGIREEEYENFVTSIDGFTLRPPVEPFYNNKDWPHLDQTESDDLYECIQGQVVLSDTSASFICSPRSHKIFPQVLDLINVKGKPGNFAKIPTNKIREVIDLIQSVDGVWQIPIIAPAGSIILWLSSVIHSAKTHDAGINSDGWRGVIYISQRPWNDVNLVTHSQKLIEAYELNKTTNHWGTKEFEPKKDCKNPKFLKYINEPKKIYQDFGKPKLTKLELLGYNV